MALDITSLEKAIFKALDESSNIKVDTDSITDNLNKSKNAREQTAQELAKAINIFVRSGTVTTTVTTAGSASAQTGTGTGKIS
jgi:septal ring factor EnvC (AmiA/AmiB activator)